MVDHLAHLFRRGAAGDLEHFLFAHGLVAERRALKHVDCLAGVAFGNVDHRVEGLCVELDSLFFGDVLGDFLDVGLSKRGETAHLDWMGSMILEE